MSVKKPKEFQPAYGLWKLYQPEKAKYAFTAKTPEEAAKWRTKVRKALRELVGFQDMPEVDPVPKLEEQVDKGDYIREKWIIRTWEFAKMPVYILKPKNTDCEKLPVVLAFHGHGYGVRDIVGLWEDDTERDTPSGYHKDFGIALCRKGFLVAAPEISCFGERQTDFSYLAPEGRIPSSPPQTTCIHTANLANHLGGSAAGLRVLDARRLVDYLSTRQDADTSRLGAMGISGGGLHTMFSTCIDTRIKAAVISGYFCTFKDSVLAMAHCACNFIPGLHQFGEMHDLIGLIAPRPVLLESASKDRIFPIEAVKPEIAKARKVYAASGAKGKLETDLFEGRHEISGAEAYDFLVRNV